MSETTVEKQIAVNVRVVHCDRCGVTQELQTTRAELRPPELKGAPDRDVPFDSTSWRSSSTWGRSFSIEGRDGPIDLCPPCSTAFAVVVLDFLAQRPR